MPGVGTLRAERETAVSPQIPDVELLSPETAISVPSPSPRERRSPDRRSYDAQTAKTPSASVAGTVSADFRCQYRYQNATRCRLRAADSESGLCIRHLRQKFAALLPSFPDDSADLSKDLLRGPLEFSSADDLREYLTRLLILMTKGGVSPRRGAVLAYITNQLLHSHVAAEKESADEEPQFIFDLPRPQRDWPDDSERAIYARMSTLHGSNAPTDSDACPASPEKKS